MAPGIVAVCAIYGALSGAIAGVLLGTQILRGEGIAKADATRLGAQIVILAHIVLGALWTCWMTPALINSQNQMKITAAVYMLITTFIVVALVSLLVAGVVTMPLGCFAARLLVDWRTRHDLPLGCSVHKYRDIYPSTTGGGT
jgi:hypothetical protein